MLTAVSASASRLLAAPRLLALTGALSLLQSPHVTQAAAATWQGGASGDWSNAANWSPSTFVPNNGNGGQTYSANLTSTSVALTEAISLDGLSLTDTTLSGNTTLTTGFLGTTLSGNNTLSSGLTLRANNRFAFATSNASLSNNGTLQFNADGSGAYTSSNATLTNSATGLIRFDPSSGVSVGDSFISPFALANSGTVLANNGRINSIYAPVTQPASGLIRATANSSLTLQSGGTLAGTLQADATASLRLSGSNRTYSLDQLAITGNGTVSAEFTNLTGSLASGTLSLGSVQLSGSFINQSTASLIWGDYNRFASEASSLTNHGTVKFSDTYWTNGSAYYDSNATLTNSATGLIRFGAFSGTSVGNTYVSPFRLANSGTIFADNFSANYLYVPVSQYSTGIIRATSRASIFFNSGGTLAGTLQADEGSSIELRGLNQTYTLDQTTITGIGYIGTDSISLTGSLYAGSLRTYVTKLFGSFVNQSAAILVWDRYTHFADNTSSLTNHGTLQLNTRYSDFGGGYIYSRSTLTNSVSGLIRFNPSTSTLVGDSYTSPFQLTNSGTILADNGYLNHLYAPITQSASGLIRATALSSLYFYGGGTLAGTLQVDGGSSLYFGGNDKTHTLDQTTLIGSFVNQAAPSIYHSAPTLRWGNGTRFANVTSSLTNHGNLQFIATGLSAYTSSNATLTNSAGGLIRFNPSSGVSVGDSSISPFLLANAGTVLADNGQLNSLYTPVTNTGLIRVTSNSSLALAGNFTQTAGEVRVENATLSSAPGQTLVFQGGLLRASGSISANLSLANTGLEIGTSQTAGSLSLSGNLTLLAGTSASFDLNGLAPGTGYDSLTINGGVTFGGDLSVRLSASLASTLTAGDSFTLVTATSFSGAFTNIQSGQRLELADDAGSFLVTLTGTALTLSDFNPPVSPFEAFLIAANVPEGQRAATDDPDSDSVPNLLEFALGLEPLNPDSDGLPLFDASGGVLTLTYFRAQPSAVTYEVQTTTDLANPASWAPNGVSQGTPDVNGVTTATVPLDNPGRFLRLGVTLAPCAQPGLVLGPRPAGIGALPEPPAPTASIPPQA